MTAQDDVIVVAHWRTTEEALTDVLTYAAAARTPSLAEPGCLTYDILQNAADPTHVVLIERYRDSAALETHLHSAHYEEWVSRRIRPLLTDRAVQFLQPRSPAES